MTGYEESGCDAGTHMKAPVGFMVTDAARSALGWDSGSGVLGKPPHSPHCLPVNGAPRIT